MNLSSMRGEARHKRKHQHRTGKLVSRRKCPFKAPTSRGARNLKKGGHLLRENPKVARFEFMKDNRGSFSMLRVACVLSVSPSGYYSWLKSCQHPSKRKQAQRARDTKVKEAFTKSKERDGARRIQAELEEQGDKHDIKPIANSMCNSPQFSTALS